MSLQEPFETAPEPRLAEALDDVVRSASEVATQRVALARIEAGEAVARGLRSGALVLSAAIFAGFVAAALWISAVGAAAWWAGQRFGHAAAVAVVVGVHVTVSICAWAAWRRTDPEE